MNLLAPISTIMIKDLITVSPSDSIKHIGDLFSKHKFHHLPVVDEGKIVGMVSKSDYLFFRRGYSNEITLDEQRQNKHKAEEIMIKGLAKLEPTDKINVVLEVFKVNVLHAIPIIDNDLLVGIVTPLDIIKHLANDKEAVNKYE